MADKILIISPFLISWPSFTLTSTTTPDIGAPTDPGSEVAFSRLTVSTAADLSSTGTARTYAGKIKINLKFILKSYTISHLSIDFEPNVTDALAFHDWPDSEQTNDKGLALLDRNVHFLARFGTTQEVPRRYNTTEETQDWLLPKGHDGPNVP